MLVLDSTPLLFLNLSGEMMYIIDQRLLAQRIDVEKSSKVRHELLVTLLSPKFIDGLFKPQPLYDMESLKMVFQKLVHCTILRLQQDSMDRLFDLMVMAVKYQMLACSRGYDVILMTLNHIDGIRRLNVHQDVEIFLQRAFETVTKTYGQYSSWRLQKIRQNLLNYLQDWRVRVSVFLREGIQYPDGYFNLQFIGPVPIDFELPGVAILPPPHASKKFDVPIKFVTSKNPSISLEFIGNRGTALGCNLFKNEPAPNKNENLESKSHTSMNAEWKLLSTLLQTECPSSDTIKLNWLSWSGNEEELTFRALEEEPDTKSYAKSTALHLDSELVRDISLLNLLEPPNAASCEHFEDTDVLAENLLDLLDQAT